MGSRSGDKLNSDLLALWQRSYTTDGSRWANMPRPGDGSVTVSIPNGLEVIQVMNLVTRQNVSYSTSSQKIRFAVSDDPIEVIFQPQ